jgi:hypothetical protein
MYFTNRDTHEKLNVLKKQLRLPKGRVIEELILQAPAHWNAISFEDTGEKIDEVAS